MREIYTLEKGCPRIPRIPASYASRPIARDIIGKTPVKTLKTAYTREKLTQKSDKPLKNRIVSTRRNRHHDSCGGLEAWQFNDGRRALDDATGRLNRTFGTGAKSRKTTRRGGVLRRPNANIPAAQGMDWSAQICPTIHPTF
jgi:hypothetical protein